MTYAQDLANIQAHESNTDVQLATAVEQKGLTANAITHFDSDHTADVAEPAEGKQHVINHDDVIEVTQVRSAAVKTGKENQEKTQRRNVLGNAGEEEQAETGEG